MFVPGNHFTLLHISNISKKVLVFIKFAYIWMIKDTLRIAQDFCNANTENCEKIEDKTEE